MPTTTFLVTAATQNGLFFNGGYADAVASYPSGQWTGYYDGTPPAGQNAGGYFVFAGVTIPNGATIDSAFLRLYGPGAAGGPFTIFAKDEAAPVKPANVYQIMPNSLTSFGGTKTIPEFFSKSLSTAPYTTTAAYSNMDITTVVSSLQSSYDYSSGSAMYLSITSRQSGYGYVFCKGSANEPSLIIAYTAGGGGPAPGSLIAKTTYVFQ
jgi:hypothetical protein